MNIYATTTFFILGLIFMYLGLDFLGFSFIVLGIISIFFKFEKEQAKDKWKQMSEAEGSTPENEFRGYIDDVAKMTAEAITPKEETKAQLTNPEKFPSASKNFLDELKKIFK